MNNLKDLLNELNKVGREAKQILKAVEFDPYEELSGLAINYDNPDEVFLQEELRGVLSKFDEAVSTLEYLRKPITGTYTLHKNRNGRYECERGELTSGSGIEFCHYNNFYERYEWAGSRVEHDGKDYYIVGYNDVPLEGLKVRFRRW